MNYYTIILVLFFSVVVDSRRRNLKKQNYPPHCTQITKYTDYIAKYKYDYPVVHIVAGQHEAYQQLFCVNPSSVNKAVTTVCDWVAPPQVQYTLGDEYLHVVRQDPTGRFLGDAVITTQQLCNHALQLNETKSTLPVISTLCHAVNAIKRQQKIEVFEYGTHVEKEELAYATTGEIPPFTPFYNHNVTPMKPNLEMPYTYLRVEYVSPMSYVDIKFDPEKLMLTFYIRFPFLYIPFGIAGYAMPKKKCLRSVRGWKIVLT